MLANDYSNSVGKCNIEFVEFGKRVTNFIMRLKHVTILELARIHGVAQTILIQPHQHQAEHSVIYSMIHFLIYESEVSTGLTSDGQY